MSQLNGNGTNRVLIGIIVLLISSHYVSMIYRLEKAEIAVVDIRKENAAAALAAAIAAANAVAAAAAIVASSKK